MTKRAPPAAKSARSAGRTGKRIFVLDTNVLIHDPTAIFLTILIMYFVLSCLLTLLTGWLERRFALDRKALAAQRKESRLMKVGAA